MDVGAVGLSSYPVLIKDEANQRAFEDGNKKALNKIFKSLDDTSPMDLMKLRKSKSGVLDLMHKANGKSGVLDVTA